MEYNFSLASDAAAVRTITVRWPGHEVKKELEKEEFNKIVSFCNIKKAVTFFPATLFAVRTHNPLVLAKDLFLPTLVNQALNVKNLVAKIFAIMGALLLDLLTYPIRILTLIPRLIGNAIKEEHPLHLFLRYHGHKKIPDSVQVELLQKNVCWQRKEIHFRDFPAGLLYSDYIESNRFRYSGKGWTFSLFNSSWERGRRPEERAEEGRR